MKPHAADQEGIEYGGEAPTVEVLVYRDGELVHRELCESAEAAADVIAEWEELGGVECVVEDLTVTHDVGQIREATSEEAPEDEYARPPSPE